MNKEKRRKIRHIHFYSTEKKSLKSDMSVNMKMLIFFT